MNARIRGADVVCRALAKAGTKRVFALSGNHIMSVFDAALDAGIDIIHVRHEAAAVHMADAEARLTGRPGIALLTGGPGHANGLSALYTAFASESPLLMLSGHAPRSQAGQGAFQEMRQAEMASAVTKASWTVSRASLVGAEIARAIRIASSGRPGPVHLSLPIDVLEACGEELGAGFPDAQHFLPNQQLLPASVAQAIANALSDAHRPLILAGPFAATAAAGDAADTLKDALGVPVVTMESPRGINDPCLGAFAEVLGRADKILLLGKQLDFTLGFARPPVIAPNCEFFQVDPDPAAVARFARATAQPGRLGSGVVADTVPAARAIAAAANGGGHAAWCDEVAAAIAYRPGNWASLSAVDGIHPVNICAAVQPLLDADPNAILISDGGEFGQWAQACLKAPRRLINGPAGAIGSAPAFAAAACLAAPHSRVIAMLGDGTFGFHLSEVDTAVRYKLPYIAVIGNDACWNAEFQIQLRDYGPDRAFGCELLPTRYDQAAIALGSAGYHVCGEVELRAALEAALAAGRVACIDAVTPRVAAPTIRRA